MATRLFQILGYLRHLGGSMRHAIVLFAMLFVMIVICEALSGSRLKRYASRNFLNDTLYGLFYQGGIYTLFIYEPFFNSLRPKLAILDLHLQARWPAYLYLPIFFVVADLFGYWMHRLRHTRFLWPFHTACITLSSSSRLSPATASISLTISRRMLSEQFRCCCWVHLRGSGHPSVLRNGSCKPSSIRN